MIRITPTHRITGPRRPKRSLASLSICLLVAISFSSASPVLADRGSHGSTKSAKIAKHKVVWLYADDFMHGTYIIDQPGTYKLAEDISFNPNSPSSLDAALANGDIDSAAAVQLDLQAPVDSYRSGWPLAAQFLRGRGAAFTPGGPTDARYDPAAYGVGFFAAIAIQADNVTVDLNGRTIEQSAEHALLQRFFAVIELADQPFVPAQGPSGFGDELDPAFNVTIKNGTIGRSAHHGIHGNASKNVVVKNVDFRDYEVAAIALNGVDGLDVHDVTASNRIDIPVVGTFSSARFISVYLDDLSRNDSGTTLKVGGELLNVNEIRDQLRSAMNNAHHDIVTIGDGFIDRTTHPAEHALFHNDTGVVDGNSYSFLLNNFGVAVNGFPSQPVDGGESRNISFRNVHVDGQHSSIREIPALSTGTTAMIDPIGAVFQLQNLDPETLDPITISDVDPTAAEYVGNVVANAQAFVAKALANGDFAASHLDTSRVNISSAALEWVEGTPGSKTLADIDAIFYCNGDSMFHVNKGAIGFKMDAAVKVRMTDTSVTDITNTGAGGARICEYDQISTSHPAATLDGYGGAAVRGYSFSGSKDVRVLRSAANGLRSSFGAASGYDVLTDSNRVQLLDTTVNGVLAGSNLYSSNDPTGPDQPAIASAWRVGVDATKTSVTRGCAGNLVGIDGAFEVIDLGTGTKVKGRCR